MYNTIWFFIYDFFLSRAPEVLKDLAPGSQPPFLIYNGEVRTDTNKIEEFLEETLAPPQWVYIHTTNPKILSIFLSNLLQKYTRIPESKCILLFLQNATICFTTNSILYDMKYKVRITQ